MRLCWRPIPNHDTTRLLIGPRGGPSVAILLLVERVWWAVGVEDKIPDPSKWTSAPLRFQRSIYTATSDSALWIRLPRKRWIEKLSFGFRYEKCRSYRVPVSENALAIPLRHFGDSEELGNLTEERHFKVWADSPLRGTAECTVAVVPAEMVRPHPARVDFEKWLTTIQTSKLAHDLRRTLKHIPRPLGVVMRELYRSKPKRRGRSHISDRDFKRQGLCAIAIAEEIMRKRGRAPVPIRMRRRQQAMRAKNAFSETTTELKRRCNPLVSQPSHRE